METEMNNQQIYNIWAATYSNEPVNPFMESEHELMSRKLQNHCLDRTIIDAACGCGRIAKLCLEFGSSKVLAFDFSPDMVEKCKKLNVDQRLTVVSGDLLNIPIRENGWDVFVSSLAVGHVPDLLRVLSEAKRSLKPGGEIIISDFHPARAQAGFTRGTSAADGTYLQLTHYVHGIHDWVQSCNRLDLKIVDVQETHLNMKHHDFERWRHHPDVPSKERFDLAFKIPSVWMFHAKRLG